VRWATRSGCHVDRAACAWLIRRFLDADAEFVFVSDPEDVPEEATPFDMRGVDLTHHGADCTFETMLKRYELDDPVLWDVARIVHEADLADENFDAPEAPGSTSSCVVCRWFAGTTTSWRCRALCATGFTSTRAAHSCSDRSRREGRTMIVCLRSVTIPDEVHDRFLAWIEENRALREENGILFELVLDRSARQNPSKTLQPDDAGPGPAHQTIVVTAWASHAAFDAWIDTPDRDRLTASDVHNSVTYGPITRHDIVGGYLNLDRLLAVAESMKEEP
jgi:hypothetical protein